jgi:hypothetical protein
MGIKKNVSERLQRGTDIWVYWKKATEISMIYAALNDGNHSDRAKSKLDHWAESRLDIYLRSERE